MILSDSFQLL